MGSQRSHFRLVGGSAAGTPNKFPLSFFQLSSGGFSGGMNGPCASTAKCKPLDGLNVWETIAEGKPSPRTEVIYNVEPFRAAVRQGDWKCIWRSMIPTSVDLYNLAEDPLGTHNLVSVKNLAENERFIREHVTSIGRFYKFQQGQVLAGTH